MARVPWWIGLTTDHLYPTCPAYARSLPELRRYGLDHRGRGRVDPTWQGVCGWCSRVWKARNPAPTTEEETHP